MPDPEVITELQPVWKQFAETLDALQTAFSEIPDDRLNWQVAPSTSTASRIIQHIARGNIGYANIMLYSDGGDRPEVVSGLDRNEVLARLERSVSHVRDVFGQITPARLTQYCMDDWCPLGLEVDGPLDVLWFAHQIVRHTAYHLGQVNFIAQLLEDGRAST